jgi:hypothetical protein
MDSQSDAAPKVYNIQHESPFGVKYRSGYRFILLPYGLLYGDVPINAGHGDKIRFLNGDTAIIKMVCRVKANSKLAVALCGMRYGQPIKLVYDNWFEMAIARGARRTAISDTEFLLLWHGPNAGVIE